VGEGKEGGQVKGEDLLGRTDDKVWEAKWENVESLGILSNLKSKKNRIYGKVVFYKGLAHLNS
jgi:hypothetical protein